jgi:hypothetical protein
MNLQARALAFPVSAMSDSTIRIWQILLVRYRCARLLRRPGRRSAGGLQTASLLKILIPLLFIKYFLSDVLISSEYVNLQWRDLLRRLPPNINPLS